MATVQTDPCSWVITVVIIENDYIGSTITNCYGVGAIYFATVSNCNQLVVSRTHVRRESIDVLLTGVPSLVQVVVIAPIGSSDQLSLCTVISMA